MIEDELSRLSYEIRTSLNAIFCFSDKLCREAKTASDDVREGWTRSLKSACRDLADKADDILIASSIGKLGEAPARNQVNLWDFVHKLMSDAEVYARGGSDIVYCTSFEQDFEFQANAPLLEAALSELLKNALQHVQGGHVILRAEPDETGDRLLFSVTDAGCGIPAEHRDRIFEWFYKIDPFKPGLGVGLPVCREIATLLGSEVTLDTGTFSGTRMCLTIPLTCGE